MKLLMFQHHDERRMGVARGVPAQDVVDLAALARAAGATSLPTDLLGLIDAGEGGLRLVRELLALPPSTVSPHVRKLTGLALLAPLDPPRGDVLAIGRNYGKHATESAQAWGEEVKPPTVFSKAQTSITGPFDNIAIDPGISDQIDWEVELGVIMGRTALNLQPAEAMRHIFGYTVVNDISARDIQNGWGGQFFKGKSLDRSSPTGPWIVTADEIPDPQHLRLSLRVNGVTKQEGNTADMLYPVAQVIAWLSIGMTLRPGTLIATGTPDGVGFARTPPEFLRPGDVLETEVEGIGLMRNRMVSATVAAER
jgi:2-keto-4-pentenoate hydratase/2-oxohepta-3-ene-1,7-dioic acid hydratase in catechol pathway